MINMYLDIKRVAAPYYRCAKLKPTGVSTLIVTVILLTATSLIALFAASYSILQTKTASNQYRSNQAFFAAEAGLEYGILYLMQNSATILASPTNGFIAPYTNASITNVTLANNAKYSIVYTNPVAYNYKIIKIAVTGVSDDGLSTDSISQFVAQGSLLITTPTIPLTALGSVSLKGSARVINNISPITISTGGNVSISGSATTTGTNGGSRKNKIGNDIQENVPALQSMTPEQLMLTYFGAPASQVQQSVANFYPSGSSPNLIGMTNTSIWVDDDLSISSSGTIGSATEPVLLIVNGNFSLTGSATIYGFVYVTGTSDVNATTAGSSQIIGGLTTDGTLNLGGSAKLTFDSTVINTLQTQTASGYFAKVPGTWKDF